MGTWSRFELLVTVEALLKGAGGHFGAPGGFQDLAATNLEKLLEKDSHFELHTVLSASSSLEVRTSSSFVHILVNETVGKASVFVFGIEQTSSVSPLHQN